MRQMTSLNWALGTLAIILAVLYPMLDAKFLVGSMKNVAEQQVDQIVKMEDTFYARSERYITFESSDMARGFEQLNLSVNAEDFDYSVHESVGGGLLVQAVARDKKVKSGALPPLKYIYTRSAEDKSVSKKWLRLSGKKYGIL